MKKEKVQPGRRTPTATVSRSKSQRSRVSAFGELGKIREIPLSELESMQGSGDLDLNQSVGYPPPSPSPAGPSPSQ